MRTDEKAGGVKKVRIIRSTSGFGLTICGGSDFPHREGDSGIFVSDVIRDDIDLATGDRIIEANNQSLQDVSHDEAIKVLKSSPDELELVVEPAQMLFNLSTEDLRGMSPTENGFLEDDKLHIEPITEIDYGTRVEPFPETFLPEPAKPELPVDSNSTASQTKTVPELESSTFTTILGTVAIVALGAALVTVVLRRQTA